MYVVFMQRYNRRPIFREIRFFYNVRNYRKGSPYLNLESARKNKPVLDLYNKFSMFKKEYFYVRDEVATRHIFCSGGMHLAYPVLFWLFSHFLTIFFFCCTVGVKADEDAELQWILIDILGTSPKTREASFLIRDDFLKRYGLIKLNQSVVKVRACTHEKEARKAGLRGTEGSKEGESGD